MLRDLLNNRKADLHQRGISLVEVLVGVAIFSLALVAITHSVTLFINARTAALHDTKAIYLAEEGLEIVRYIRDDGWNNLNLLAVDTPYYLDATTTSITGTSEVIDGEYYRSFMVRDVYRDSGEDIVASTTPGSSIATGTLSVIMRVSQNGTGTTTLQTILTNLFGS